MKIFFKTIIALGMIFATAHASAGFMIEPFAGYQMGDFKSDGTTDTAGTEFGLRLGGTAALFMYGAEYASGSQTVKGAPGEEDTDIDLTDMGVFVGVEFPVLIRLYATYFVKSEVDLDGGSIVGNGSRIGLGFTGLPLVSINVESIARTYDELDDGTALTDKVKINTTMLSVSIPLP